MTTPPVFTLRTACRVCGGPFDRLLDLGALTLSDFLAPDAPDPPAVPLDLVVCTDCALVQLRHTTDPNRLYRGSYWYRSHVNEVMVAELRDVVAYVCQVVPLQPGDIVVDIGANDGTLLAQIPPGVLRVAYEPATVLQSALAAHADVIVQDLWGYDAYTEGLPAQRANTTEDQSAQQSALVGDAGGSKGADTHGGNKGEDSSEVDRARVLGDVANETTAGSLGQEANPSGEREATTDDVATVRTDTENQQAGTRRTSLQVMEGSRSTSGEGVLPDLPSSNAQIGSRSHQTVRVIPDAAVRSRERTSAVQILSSNARMAWQPRSVKAIFSIAMFYDVDDPRRFVAEVDRLLTPDGVWVVQFQDLGAMVGATGFDNICHEHLCYYSLQTFQRLLREYDLAVRAVARRTINGGSLRITVGRRATAWTGTFAEDWDRGSDRDSLDRFAWRVHEVAAQLRGTIEMLTRQDLPVDLYAASTKSSTLLQVCGIDHRRIRQAVERTPEKVGKVTSGTRIPIVSEADWRVSPAPAVLVGAWQFKDAFVKREAEYLSKGGSFLVPLPRMEVVCGQGPA